ncbi:hypothetical protein G6F57_015890 [Rhizopus arrhizus]|nr:hypothetical protein G6F57_015890 [Rhizopus arrhizus]
MATGTFHADRTASASAQARSWKLGRRRQPSGARERWKPDRGETPRRLDAQHDSATGHLPGGRGRPDFKTEWTTGSGRARAGHRGSAVDAVWPIRRSRVGDVQGRQVCAAGIARRAFPWRQAKRVARRKGREGIRPSRQDAGWIAQPAPTAKSSSADSALRAHSDHKARWAGRNR